MSVKQKKYRSRAFFLLLYPDNKDHVKVFEHISKTYEYVAIKHDKDEADQGGGEVKKEHWHVYLRFKNAKWNTSLCDEMGLSARFVEDVRSEKAALEYLLHANEETKHRYQIADLLGSKTLIKRLETYLKDDTGTAEEQFEELARAVYVENIQSYAALLEYAVQKSLVKELRKSSYMLSRMVDENRKFAVLASDKSGAQARDKGARVAPNVEFDKQ